MSPGGRLLPGVTIGVVGGGQLGRMLGLAARRMGLGFNVLAPGDSPPAAAVADRHFSARLDDERTMRAFAESVDVLTFEFENVSSAALEAASEVGLVRPSPAALHTTQHRGREKVFLRLHGIPTARFRLVGDVSEVPAAVEEVGVPCVVKTAGFGYDGKGQVVIEVRDAVRAAVTALAGAGALVVEERVDLAAELSVVVARGPHGDTATYAPFLNRHVGQVLDVTLAPFTGGVTSWGPVGPAVVAAAREEAERVAARLELVGLCCVEFFLDRAGELLVNEIAPRPHNSGHLTVEAAETSQFEQQLRAVCGLPLGSTVLPRPAAMANLLGDLWSDGDPDLAAALRVPGVALHLYGKSEARPGRKMGHLTATADSVEEAEEKVLRARTALSRARRPAA